MDFASLMSTSDELSRVSCKIRGVADVKMVELCVEFLVYLCNIFPNAFLRVHNACGYQIHLKYYMINQYNRMLMSITREFCMYYFSLSVRNCEKVLSQNEASAGCSGLCSLDKPPCIA